MGTEVRAKEESTQRYRGHTRTQDYRAGEAVRCVVELDPQA